MKIGRRVLSWIGIFLMAHGVAANAEASGEEQTRLVLFGIDGLSWKVLGPLVEAGELPHFARLISDGAHMPRFETMESTSSPVVWTTVATGRNPTDHGVKSFRERLPNRTLIPISGNSRTAKAIWEIASQQGMTVGVTGWWASWPAETVNGYIISDHANPAFSDFMVADGEHWTADAEKLSSMQRDVYPRDLVPIVSKHWMQKDAVDWADVRRRSGWSAEQMARLEASAWNERNLYSILKTFYLVDYPLFRVAHELIRKRPTRLTMLYLRGPDPIQHYGWDLVEPAKFANPSVHLARDRGLVEGVYRILDSLLGELLAQLDDKTWLIVASDHGAEPTAGAETADFSRRPGGHTQSAKGVLFIRGPHVKAGHVLTRGSPTDLMPTMVWLLGLPRSEELAGEELFDAFEADFVRSHARRMVKSYGPREQRELSASPADEMLLESLRALGYIE